ncbi:MAG: hypothetical protein H8D88_00650 [Bacteroidetes bacterium]|nr:hypothetical protein [Bacteroidota bacterium]
MAQTTSNALTKNYRGKFGNHFSFRNRNGKSILASLPKRKRKKDRGSAAQQQTRRRFANASHYAKHVLLEPDMLADYTARAKKGMTAYNVALTDFLLSPWIETIDVEGYTGNPGDLIRVQAFDDFQVTEVNIRIIDANGNQVEAGPCQAVSRGIWWEYTASVAITSLAGIQIIAIARDNPGNKTEESMIF